MSYERKPLWPGFICVLGFWGNLLFGIGFLITIPDGMADLKHPDPDLKNALYLISVSAIISAFSYWIVGTGYDWGRWAKLATNVPLSIFLFSIAFQANNINIFTVLASVAPLIWPLFLLRAFRRKPR